MIQKLLQFLKNPVYKKDDSLNLNNKFKLLFRLLVLALLISFGIAIVIGILEKGLDLDLGKHAIEQLFEDYSPDFIFVMAVVLAPLTEELVFRGPMYLFRNSKYFGYIFYLFTLAFGFYHITNFEINATILLLSPLLVAPQIIIGLLLGYIRVQLGLAWSILLHSLYNLVLIGPIVLLQTLNMPMP